MAMERLHWTTERHGPLRQPRAARGRSGRSELLLATLACKHCHMDKQAADLDNAQSRSTRFGKLPARVRPDTTVEMVDTSPPQGRPEAAVSEEQRRVLFDGA